MTTSVTGPAPTGVWVPTPEQLMRSPLTKYESWLYETKGRTFQDFEELWSWSITETEEFWLSLARFFGVDEIVPPAIEAGFSPVWSKWFPQVELNYARYALRHDSSRIAAIEVDETGSSTEVTFGELRHRSEVIAGALERIGVGVGDRVAAVIPNSIDALALFLGCARMGAVWCCISPELGDLALGMRLSELAPVVLFVSGDYVYAGRHHSPAERVVRVAKTTSTIRVLVQLGGDSSSSLDQNVMAWTEFVDGSVPYTGYRMLPFSEPLWVLFTSGTTGKPRGIVHGHGGIIIEHLKLCALHFDLTEADRFMWLTSSGWVAWNLLVGALLVGSSIVLYGGSPTFQDGDYVWRQVREHDITTLGLSPSFLELCRSRKVDPQLKSGASRLRTVITSGSPLTPQTQQWIYDKTGSGTYVCNVSGGTEFATILLGAVPILPVRSGWLQHSALGVRLDVLDEGGTSMGTGQAGELVVVGPMPSIPLGLVGDTDGSLMNEKYLSRFEGKWHHGDFVEFAPDGGAVIHGRSDGTLKRGGVRLGASEYYEEILEWSEVVDALVIDVQTTDTAGQIIMFVEMADAQTLDDGFVAQFSQRIQQHLSPRHVPDRIFAVPKVPRNLNGKRLEVPVKNLFMGKRESMGELTAADPLTATILSQLADDISRVDKDYRGKEERR